MKSIPASSALLFFLRKAAQSFNMSMAAREVFRFLYSEKRKCGLVGNLLKSSLPLWRHTML